MGKELDGAAECYIAKKKLGFKKPMGIFSSSNRVGGCFVNANKDVYFNKDRSGKPKWNPWRPPKKYKAICRKSLIGI